MFISYKKPVLDSFSATDIIEKLGPCQNQYNTLTLNTVAGDSGVNIDGTIVYKQNYGVFIKDAFTHITIGDNYQSPTNNYLERGFVGFDLSGIPGNSTIVSAMLRISQIHVYGIPYTTLGNIVVDHINFGTSLDDNDWNDNTITSNIGTISINDTLDWKEVDVKTAVQADLNASRTSSQFRLRFSPNEASATQRDDSLCNPADYGGDIPQLVIVYK